MNLKVFILLFGFQMLYAAESPWMVYTEPAANKQCRVVIHDLERDTMIMDYIVPLQWGLSKYYFFSKTSIVGVGRSGYCIIDLKNKSITPMSDWDYKTVVFNQGVWAKMKGDTIFVGTPEETSKILFNDETEYQYKEIERLEWVCKNIDTVYLCMLVLSDDNKQHRILMIKDKNQKLFYNITRENQNISMSWHSKVKKSQDYNIIGVNYYDRNKHMYELFFWDLNLEGLIPIAKDVYDFTWLNSDSLVLYRYNKELKKYQIELFDIQTKKRNELFEYEHWGNFQNMFIYNNCLYFKHFSRHLEIFTKIKFMKYDFTTGEFSEVFKFNRSRSEFYEGYLWDIMYVDVEE